MKGRERHWILKATAKRVIAKLDIDDIKVTINKLIIDCVWYHRLKIRVVYLHTVEFILQYYMVQDISKLMV